MKLTVGPLRSTLPERDRDALRSVFAGVSEVVAARGARTWCEPDPADAALERVRPSRATDSLSGVELLAFAAARAASGGSLAAPDDPDRLALPSVWDTADLAAYARVAQRFDRHLVSVPMAVGSLFVPVELPCVLIDAEGRLPNGALGSSVALYTELCALAPHLGVELESMRSLDSSDHLVDEESRRLGALAAGGDVEARDQLGLQLRRRGLVPSGDGAQIDTRRLGDAAITAGDEPSDPARRRVIAPFLALFEAARLSLESGCSIRIE